MLRLKAWATSVWPFSLSTLRRRICRTLNTVVYPLHWLLQCFNLSQLQRKLSKSRQYVRVHVLLLTFQIFRRYSKIFDLCISKYDSVWITDSNQSTGSSACNLAFVLNSSLLLSIQVLEKLLWIKNVHPEHSLSDSDKVLLCQMNFQNKSWQYYSKENVFWRINH